MSSPPTTSRLTPTTRLGPYEITGSIGAGGMGEVYRARDARLDRDVAIKLLPPQLARNEQFRVRFEREAKSVSQLNHPHICTLHDVGQETVNGDELHYLVLEMIEGESLADRLRRGPLPLADVLRVGSQIASALDAAHKRGIVHRDLKPGNVMLTKTGAKLLDFGLAKSDSESAVVEAFSSLNTVDKPLTEQGTIVGTFQYMAPEQLEGTDADARTDIFALGALLFEMATGRRAFDGKSRTSLIAAIVSSQPPTISSITELSPPALDHVVAKCLEKDPDDRWQSARDVMAELQWISEGGSRAGLPAVVSTRRRKREGLAWAAFAIAAATAVLFAVLWARRAPAPAAVVRFAIPHPEGLSTVGPPTVSPDGRMVAFGASDGTGKQQIWLRPLDAIEARVVPGTEGVRGLFWSPDSRFVAFTAAGKLRKVAVAGGPPQPICDTPTGADGSWSASGAILFDGQGNDPIWRVDAAGGAARVEVPGDEAGGGVGWPEFLPDGKHYLYTTAAASGDPTLMVRALGESKGKELLKAKSRVVYAEPGYLIFVREQTLVAQPFDAASQQLRGEPVPIGEGLGVDNVGGASFSTSRTGVLAFRSGETAGSRLLWFDRNGKEAPALDDVREYTDTWFSPDGKRLALDLREPGGKGDIWIRDLPRGISTRFTFDAERDFAPVWSPDGRRIVYSSQRGAWDLYWKDAAGTGEPELLVQNKENKFATDWSSDGSYIVFSQLSSETGWDVWALPLQGERKPIPLRRTKFGENNGVVSPDGRFLAWHSNESGRTEIYVQEFPDAKSKWQISTNGGREPSWRGDGRELYYRSPDARVMAVPIESTGATLNVGTPQSLFQARFASTNSRALYRPTRDGQRFLIVAPIGRDAIPPATVVLNWTASLH